MQENRRSSGSSWLGWLIFFFLIFGTRFVPPVANWLSQQTGLTITAPMLIASVIFLSVLVNITSSIVQSMNRSTEANKDQLPTGLPPTSQAPPRPTGTTTLPPPLTNEAQWKERAYGKQQLPAPPQFEPIINPRILLIGSVVMVAMGIMFFILLILVGAI